MPNLEDKFGDIVAKMRRSKNLPIADLAQQSGLTESELADLFTYKFTPCDATISKLATALGLHEQSLLDSAHARWNPKPVDLAKIGCLDVVSSPFDDYFVNAYIAWDKTTKQAVLFDTGADFAMLDREIIARGLKVELLLLTHIHPDHIVGVGDVIKKYGCKVLTSPKEPTPGAQPLNLSEIHSVGALKIATLETDGHSVGGLTFVVTGIAGAPPIAIVGDAIFSGSMGGPMISYENLNRNIRQKILTLPDATILCPGHGPLTTVGEEKQHNPFFA